MPTRLGRFYSDAHLICTSNNCSRNDSCHFGCST